MNTENKENRRAAYPQEIDDAFGDYMGRTNPKLRLQ